MRASTLPNVAFVATALALSACDASSELASDESEIQAGNRTRAYPAVGVVHQTMARSFCTGTLVAPDIVLTAAHCVEGDERIDAFYTGNGKATADDSVDPTSLGMVRHEVAEQIVFPGYGLFYTCPNPELDVALLRLATPITDIAPIALGASPAIDRTCVTVGFGAHDTGTEAGTTTFLEKRAASVTVVAARETSVDVRAKSGSSSHGDSGGPLLCGGALVATTSCLPDWPLDIVAYGNVSAGRAWIDAMIADWKPKATAAGSVDASAPSTDAGRPR